MPIDYKNPTPVAACLVPVRCSGERKLFGIIRNNHPGFGGLALPGGYVDKGESIEQAAARELLEETGLETQTREWEPLMSVITEENRVLVFCVLQREYAAQSLASLPVVSDEIQGFALINPRSDLVFPAHAQAVARYYAAQLALQTQAQALAGILLRDFEQNAVLQPAFRQLDAPARQQLVDTLSRRLSA